MTNPIESQATPRYVRPVGYPGVPNLGIEHIAPLQQISEGYFTNEEIANALDTSIASVERSFSRLYEFFATSSRVTVWVAAISNGMIRGPRRKGDAYKHLDINNLEQSLHNTLFSEDEYSHVELAEAYGLSTNQIRSQFNTLYSKLPVDTRYSRLGAVVTAVQHGVLPLPKERFDLFTGYCNSPLSDYQTRVLGVLALTEMSQYEFADLANTSVQSVNNSISKARKKMAAKSTTDLMNIGVEEKWLPQKRYRLAYPRYEIVAE